MLTVLTAAPPLLAVEGQTLFDLLRHGGPLMVPIALASVIALATIVERLIGLGAGRLGSARYGRSLVEAATAGGIPAARERLGPRAPLLGRILEEGLVHDASSAAERDRRVGDRASTESKRLLQTLKPLQIVWLIAPLLGLLGTVWGMIEAFGEIAGSSALGKPELLAGGIYQALVTTAAGLSVAIPALVAYHLLKGRIERFARQVEDTQRAIERALEAREGGAPALAGPRARNEDSAGQLKDAGRPTAAETAGARSPVGA